MAVAIEDVRDFAAFAESAVTTANPPATMAELVRRWAEASKDHGVGKAGDGRSPTPVKSAYDLLVEGGFIGPSDADHPPDLSTNPKYMEGFGE